MLSLTAFEAIDTAFGGAHGLSFDLLALDSNAVRDRDGYPLPHFSPFPSPQSRGVNLFCQDLRAMDCLSNPYVFPPFSLIGAVLKFFYSFGIPFTILLPLCSARKYWCTELMARASDNLCLRKRGYMNVLLSPSKGGYMAVPCPVDLWLHIIDNIHRWWSTHYSIVLVLIL